MSSEKQSPGDPLLTFGVVSDLHVIAENVDRGWQGNARAFRNALRWFAEAGVDAVQEVGSAIGDLATGAWDALFG